MSREFRFGAVSGAARTAEEWAQTARRTEELGYATLLCPDTTGTFSPFTALTAAAAATSTLRLGTYVLASPLRTPGALAWETASLDLLSGGRFELGLGAGRPAAKQDAARLGVQFGTPGERIAQLQAQLEAVRARFAGTDPAGQYDAVRGVQRPHPRILMAGAGPRMLEIAARDADTVALGLPPLSTEADLAAKVEELRGIAGWERFDALELNLNLGLVGEEFPPFARSWFGADPAELFRIGSVTAIRGTPKEMAEVLLRRRDATGISYVSVNGLFLTEFAPVVELLAGR